VDALPSGSVINISFSVLDNKDRPSSIEIFSITIVAKPIIEVPEGNITGTVNWTSEKFIVSMVL
jgi:hypothetical protein